MSDISISITWWELLSYSPVIGWPGLVIGAVVGWFAWRRRPILGALAGAIIGNLLVFGAWVFTR